MSEFLSVITNPLISRALIVGALVSLCAAMLGVVLVLKRFSLIGHGNNTHSSVMLDVFSC